MSIIEWLNKWSESSVIQNTVWSALCCACRKGWLVCRDRLLESSHLTEGQGVWPQQGLTGRCLAVTCPIHSSNSRRPWWSRWWLWSRKRGSSAIWWSSRKHSFWENRDNSNSSTCWQNRWVPLTVQGFCLKYSYGIVTLVSVQAAAWPSVASEFRFLLLLIRNFDIHAFFLLYFTFFTQLQQQQHLPRQMSQAQRNPYPLQQFQGKTHTSTQKKYPCPNTKHFATLTILICGPMAYGFSSWSKWWISSPSLNLLVHFSISKWK